MRGQDGVTPQGSLRVDFSFRYFSLDKPANTHGGRVLVPWIDFATESLRFGYHAETPSDHTILALDVSHGLTQRITLTASLPFIRRSFGFQHAVGSGAAPSDPHGHAAFDPNAPFVEQRYTTSGIGDLQAGARYALHVGSKSRWVGGLSARVPTGSYEAAEAPVGIFHPSFQSGSGSWAAIGSMQYSRQGEGVGWSLSGSYQKNLKNSLRFTPGDELIVAAALNYDLSKRTASSVQIKLNHLRRSRYGRLDVPSTGSSFIYLTPGLRFKLAAGASIYALVPFPIFQEVRDSQLVPRMSLLGGVSKDF